MKLSVRSIHIGLVSFCILVNGSFAGEYGPVKMQLVKIENVNIGGTPRKVLKGIGTGPYATAYPNGIVVDEVGYTPGVGDPPRETGLAGGRVENPILDKEVEFGSIAATKGSRIRYLVTEVKAEVRKIQKFTMELTVASGDTFKDGSDGGQHISVERSVDKKILTWTIAAGKELGEGDYVWMLMPQADQPGRGGTPKLKGKAVSVAPFLERGGTTPPKKRNETLPRASDEGTSTVRIHSGTNQLEIVGGLVSKITYANGTVIVANSANEDMIGAQVALVGTHVVGPSPDVPQAYQLTDGAFFFDTGAEFTFGGYITDVLLYADSSVPGFNSVIQGTLGYDMCDPEGSRYLQENYHTTFGSAVFVRTNILDQNGQIIFNSTVAANIRVAGLALPVSIPALSTWGFITLLLLSLCAGTIIMKRRATSSISGGLN